MTLGTLLVLLGLILALVALFADRVGFRYGGVLVPLSVVLVALGVLVGADTLIHA